MQFGVFWACDCKVFPTGINAAGLRLFLTSRLTPEFLSNRRRFLWDIICFCREHQSIWSTEGSSSLFFYVCLKNKSSKQQQKQRECCFLQLMCHWQSKLKQPGVKKSGWNGSTGSSAGSNCGKTLRFVFFLHADEPPTQTEGHRLLTVTSQCDVNKVLPLWIRQTLKKRIKGSESLGGGRRGQQVPEWLPWNSKQMSADSASSRNLVLLFSLTAS